MQVVKNVHQRLKKELRKFRNSLFALPVRRNTIKVRTVRSVAARMEQGGSHVEHDKTCTGGIT